MQWEISPGFWLLLGLALLAGAGEVLPLVLVAAVCHELGHLAALGLLGAKVERFRLTAFGADIQADTRYMPYGRELLCTLAGPAVNLCLAFLFARVTGDYLLAGANLLLGGFNLLPVPSLDGGQALHILVSWWLDPMAADAVCRRVGLACGAALTVLAAVLTMASGGGLFLLLAAIGTLLPQLPQGWLSPVRASLEKNNLKIKK